MLHIVKRNSVYGSAKNETLRSCFIARTIDEKHTLVGREVKWKRGQTSPWQLSPSSVYFFHTSLTKDLVVQNCLSIRLVYIFFTKHSSYKLFRNPKFVNTCSELPDVYTKKYVSEINNDEFIYDI